MIEAKSLRLDSGITLRVQKMKPPCAYMLASGWHEDMLFAITREKTIKGWKRRWKIELIGSTTPDWRDIHPNIP